MSRLSIIKRSIMYSTGLLVKSSRFFSILYVITMFLNVLLPLAKTFLLSLIINDLIFPKDQTYLYLYAGSFVAATLFSRFVEELVPYVMGVLNEKISQEYDIGLANKVNDLPLSYLDSSEGKDLIDEVSYAKSTVVSFYVPIITIVSVTIAFVIAFIEMLKFNLIFSVLFIFLTIPGIIVDYKFSQKSEVFRIKHAPDARKFSYYKWMLLDQWPSKDVRTYNLSDHLRGRYNEEKGKYLRANRKIDKKKLGYSLITETIKESGLLVFTAFVIYQAVQEKVTLGDIALYVGFAATICMMFETSAEMVVDLFSISLGRMKTFFSFWDGEKGEKRTTSRHVSDFNSIVFKNVFFKYPSQEDYVLKGVSFQLHRGERLSIVGVNGAGKTTIIKLMLGFYEPDQGEILLNGYPIGEYFVDELHGLFSVMFQTYSKYPFTLRENVAMSAIQNREDTETICEALALSKFTCDGEDDLNRNLTKRFSENGIELSGGQWQKVALARTYFRKASIVIFDEPSSALDADAEDFVFQNYHEMSDGKTGIMISHKIYGGKYSTRVVVLNEGRIEEDGTHEELLNNNALYAQLFKMQKEKYAMGV